MGQVLHEQLPQFLRQNIVCRRRDCTEGDEYFVCRGEVVGRWESGGGVGEDGHGVGTLAFWKKWDTDGDEGVVVGGDEAVEEGTAEALDSRGGACEPGFGDAEDLAITALNYERWRKFEGTERRKK